MPTRRDTVQNQDRAADGVRRMPRSAAAMFALLAVASTAFAADGWEQAQQIPMPPSVAAAPALLIDARGGVDAVVATGARLLTIARRDPTTRRWQVAARVSRSGGRAARAPIVGVNGRGDAVVAWVDQARTLWRSTRTGAVGAAFTKSVRLARNVPASPRVLINETGAAAISWIDEDGKWHSRLRPGPTSAFGRDEAGRLVDAIGPNGTAVSRVSRGVEVRSATGQWTRSEIRWGSSAPAGQSPNDAAVKGTPDAATIDSKGRVVVSWIEFGDGSSARPTVLYVATAASGTAFSAPRPLARSDGQTLVAPIGAAPIRVAPAAISEPARLVAGPSGLVAVLWQMLGGNDEDHPSAAVGDAATGTWGPLHYRATGANRPQIIGIAYVDLDTLIVGYQYDQGKGGRSAPAVSVLRGNPRNDTQTDLPAGSAARMLSLVAGPGGTAVALLRECGSRGCIGRTFASYRMGPRLRR